MGLHLTKNIKMAEPTRKPINEIPLKEINLNYDDQTPEPGMLGTEYVGSDRYAIVCIDVLSPKRVSVLRLYDISEDNVYTNEHVYLDNNGIMWYEGYEKLSTKNVEIYSLRKNNKWHKAKSNYSSPISFGYCNPYRDPSF